MFGDIIYVERRPTLHRSTKGRENLNSRWIDKLIFRTVPYRHYGVEVENGYVIHFHASSYFNRKQSRIVKVTMDEFLLDGEKAVLGIPSNRYSRQATVERAYSMLGEVELAYSVNKNNCEHFAYWCATGQRVSNQTAYIKRGKTILMIPAKKVGPITVRTKDFTVNWSLRLYRKILRRA